MATYLKPTSKFFDLPSCESTELNLSDLMCPVCRGILIEPVTLPCAHSLCLKCLNGTIQHNSLSCPLCRVRVGSWLRTATKSSTLINDGLWKSMKARFSKEIQAKHDGEETDLNPGFVTRNKYVSAPGEIRREYEAQLQRIEEEMRRRREAERIASEALIRQIQAEERERFNQLAKDTAIAKNLAKRNLASNVRAKEKRRDLFDLVTGDRAEYRKSKEGGEWNSNIALISKLRAESYQPGSQKVFVNKITPQASQTYMPKASCSNSTVYGTQIKEELHVPNDVLSRKKKSLGVEVCLATRDSHRRIGSAESSGSHDSINIEIHHFKPIKSMPRTPLKTMPDGRQIDPKLIRVVAMLKRVQNAVLKPPTPMQLKRFSGCSYSAFKGKSRKILKQEEPVVRSVLKKVPEREPSTSSLQSQQQTNSSRLGKSQISETVRRLDLSSEISYDGNKNYAKNINRIINGTRVSKKLILDEEFRFEGTSNATNGENPDKFKRRRQNSSSNEREESESDGKINDSGDEAHTSNSTNHPRPLPNHRQPTTDDSDDAGVPAVENIAERIKKRKISRRRNTSSSAVSRKRRKVAEKKTATISKSMNPAETQEALAKETWSQPRRRKHRKGRDEDIDSQAESMQDENPSESSVESIDVDPVIEDIAGNVEGATATCSSKRLTRNSAKGRQDTEKTKTPVRGARRPVARRRLDDKNPGLESDLAKEDDDEVVREQKRLEELVLQEKKDFELAQRLQAKFDEMERISGRTRGSRQRERGEVAVGGFNPVFSGSQTVRNDGVELRDRFSRQLLIQDEENSARGQNNKRRVTRRRCVQ